MAFEELADGAQDDLLGHGQSIMPRLAQSVIPFSARCVKVTPIGPT